MGPDYNVAYKSKPIYFKLSVPHGFAEILIIQISEIYYIPSRVGFIKNKKNVNHYLLYSFFFFFQ